MSRLLMVWKSLRQHALSTAVTAVSIALATGLWLAVWVVKDQSQKTFTSVSVGFDGVLGARGSQLQLILNAIFHLEASPGNLPFSDYEQIKKDPRVQLAVPIAVGDNYMGYRLVGTTPELFEKAEYSPGKKFAVRPGGRWFDPQRRVALVGSFVAQKLNLKVGDSFNPYHGLVFNEADKHAEVYVVVGIMEPSNTPTDRVIWIPLAGLQNMAGHDPATANDVSAVLVKLSSPMAGQQMTTFYNRQGTRLTFAWPIGMIVAQLFDKIAWFERVLTWIAYLVALVAIASVLASIYNTMNERRREIAILRALGARRGTIFSIVVLEAMAIAALGSLIGCLVYAGLMSVVAEVIRSETGVVLQPFAWSPVLIIAPVAMTLFGGLAGIIPAIKAYRTDVAQHLLPTS